ncbi:MAG: hypothetical protein KBT29_07555 [Prevotellaceae bacterium]|nr:hypothetical protein [Candidatus Minthosoma caballi]
MNIRTYKLIYMIAAMVVATVAMVACSDHVSSEGEESGGKQEFVVPDSECIVKNVAVIANFSLSVSEENVRNMQMWAEENFNRGMKNLQNRTSGKKYVKLNCTYYDEDSIGEDMVNFARKIAMDESVDAVIGINSFENQDIIETECSKTLKPYIIPIDTSDEFVKEYSNYGNMWLIGNTVVQECEVLAYMCKSKDYTDVSLICEDNDYGDSFWWNLAFSLNEHDMDLDITSFLRGTEDDKYGIAYNVLTNTNGVIICALDNYESASLILSAYYDVLEEEGYIEDNMPELLFTSRLYSSLLGEVVEYFPENVGGVGVVGDPTTGFALAYRARFGTEPYNGSQVFDAFHLLQCAVLYGEVQNSSVNDAISSLTQVTSLEWDAYNQYKTGWMAGLFEKKMEKDNYLYYSDGLVLDGASGPLASQKAPYIGFSTYCSWEKYHGRIINVATFGWEKYSSVTQDLELEWTKLDNADKKKDVIDDDGKDIESEYKEPEKVWAVIVNATNGYENYRFTSSALSFYQLLKENIIDDDHIIMIGNNDVAGDPSNFAKDSIFLTIADAQNKTNNLNHDVIYDYKLTDLTPSQLKNIFLGDASLPGNKSIHPTENDNILFMWFGHGMPQNLSWGGEVNDRNYKMFTRDDMKDLCLALENPNGKKLFNKMLIYIDACNSGSMVDFLDYFDTDGYDSSESESPFKDILALTATEEDEPSRAAQPYNNAWLCNDCSQVFYRNLYNDMHYRDIYNVYLNLYKETTTSHPTLYGNTEFGSLSSIKFCDFFSGYRTHSGGIDYDDEVGSKARKMQAWARKSNLSPRLRQAIQRLADKQERLRKK